MSGAIDTYVRMIPGYNEITQSCFQRKLGFTRMLKADKENARLIEILDSIKCVGPVLISTIITALPELGVLYCRRATSANEGELLALEL